MLTTPHLLIGMYLVSKVSNPFLGLVTALLSHFIFDFCFPHWNPHLYTEKKKKGKISQHSVAVILIDLFLGGLFSLIILYPLFKANEWQRLILLSLGGLMAIIPDIIEIPYYFLNSKNRLLKKYILFEHNHQLNSSPFWGVLSQVVLVLITLYLLLFP